MRRRGGQALLLIAATLVSVAVVAAFLHTGSQPGPREEPDRAVLGASTAATVDECADLLLLGVDGAGEAPSGGTTYGRTVGVFARAFTRQALGADRTVEQVRVSMASRPTARLLRDRPDDRRALRSVSATKARAWMKPVPAAGQRLLALVDRHAFACPDQQLVLVGHAQGAAVVHRALTALAGRPDGLRDVVGAALVADPDRRVRTRATSLGAPAAAASRSGIAARRLGAVPDVPARTATYAAWSVCTAGDLVCDPQDVRVTKALQKNRSYAYGPGAAALRKVAAGLLAKARLRPVARPEVQVATAPVRQPFALQLAVSTSASGVVWQDARNLPPGLTLDATGLLSGTPTEFGTWNVSYVVRGTDPVTAGATGVVVVTVPAGPASVSAGGQVSCQVREGGSAWCWGRNNFGQLGDGTTTTRTRPVAVAGGDTWRSISTSGATTCAIRTDATLWCWGLGHHGQLGTGKGPARSTPAQVGSSAAWTSVSAGWFHTCGTRSNGSLWCWGSNLRGQLGDGTFTTRGRPKRVGTANDWASVAAGGWFTCATRTGGTAWCWGQNTFGQLGSPESDPQPTPTQVGTGTTWASLDAGWAHTCGTTVEGAALCWGRNDRGQLGDATRSLRRSPEPVTGGRIWTSISAGDATTCAVDNTGSAWCWGSGRYGQIGDGSRSNRTVPTLVVAERAWLSLDAGWFHACGGLDTGATACWGNNELGQVGDGSTNDRPLPEGIS
ncbi:cutinase family protein [Nocardioides sp. zg-579]|uniref:Cutinase family protein n=1 Tax=Nocardioides marmotae TaxID=2663857 RepID=A0A6I3JA01_9ACTN|nr:cutinase family protein [Nocardioides marmotae]MCR6031471.1 cutinase family protein [Gordonia jinghuaiqii]MTB95110.1 cutinase family protein [Nocardioides marmotae]QKE02401.1 cutinase family protein [Nocardioides marmotae]